MNMSIQVLTLLYAMAAGAAPDAAAEKSSRPGSEPVTDAVSRSTSRPRLTPAQPTPQASRMLYQPPRRGAPRTRTGGGTRTTGEWISMTVLAPEDTGLTTSAQPALYWQLTSATTAKFEFVLSDERVPAPVWRESFTGPLAPGVHALGMKTAGVSLLPGVTYRWSVAIVRDAAQRSRDIVSSGTVEYVAPEPAFAARIAAAAPEERAAVYAAGGYWYEAVDALQAWLAAHPGDARALADRTALLDQVGLGASGSR